MKIPLFFDGYDLKAYDFPGGRPLSHLRERLRYHYRLMKGAQPSTGFYVAFSNLAKSLEMLGHEICINDFGFARRNPDYPVGFSGYLAPLARFGLQNPILYGPGRVPDPDHLAALRQRMNLATVTYPSPWPIMLNPVESRDLFAPMFVGIDTDAWPDLSSQTKTVDILLYNKVRWEAPTRDVDLMAPLRALFKARGLTVEEIHYGHHTPEQFRASLGRSRTMVFCTEHETQGLACQEAMSSGLPIFSWDEGKLSDPSQQRIAPGPVTPSSVPYFDDRCGLRFTTQNIEERFDQFWNQRHGFSPRDYVVENLSLLRGGQRFMELYGALCDRAGIPTDPSRPVTSASV